MHRQIAGWGMDNLFAELKRRHIYRVAAGYAVLAWLLLQIVNNVVPIIQAPAWVSQSFLLLLVLGFPLAIFFAWMRELPPSDAAAPMRATVMDMALIGILIAVLGAVTYQQVVLPQTTIATQPSTVEAARQAGASPVGISVAVLPFTNLSSDKEQEFFSDGITEEITSALAKVPDLRVVARTSAFEFKGQNRDIQIIGRQLHATHLIEGSVRKAGERVRVTAQLIKSDDGTHIWSENYDRELTDVFAIQEDIATAIAGALRMPLGLKPGERLVSSRSVDAESYQQYLRAKALVRLRARGVPAAIEILEPLVARNPDYAPAWAQLAAAYGLTPTYSRNGPIEGFRRAVDTFLPKAEAAARRAIQLDPNLADGYLDLASLLARRGKWLLAEEPYSKALALDPNNPDILGSYSSVLASVGRLKESLAMKQQLRALEPFVPSFNQDVAEILWLNGQDDPAIAMLKESSLGGNKIALATIYAAMGRYSEAADVIQEITAGLNQPPPETVAEAARLLRTAPAKAATPQRLPRLGTLAFVYLYVGAPNRTLESYEQWSEAGYFNAPGIYLLWHSSYAAVRKTERFKAFARKFGFVEYWRAKGWPEFCHPTTGDDFECS